MATALDQATRDAVMAEANARAQRFGISPEQALYNYARENNISNADVDTYMGYTPGSADAWVRQRDAANAVTHPNTPAPAYAGLSSTSFPSGIARAYHEWSAANGGDTPANQAAAQNYLSSLGINQNTIEAAYNAYQAPVSSVRQAPVAPAPQAQQPAPQGNSYTAPSTPAASPATTAARQPLYAGLSNNSNANDIAAAYREWSGSNGGDTTENQRAAEGYLSNLGIGSGAIRDAYTAYKGQQQPQQPQQQPQQPSQNLGIGGSYNPQQNPYLGQMGRDIGSQMFDNWSRTQMPSIRSGAMAAGGFGGSRQGVVEANGMNDMNRQYGQALTSMYGNDWSQQQGRNLQQQGLNNSYDLGLRSNELQNRSVNNSYDLGLRSSDLGFANLDANINQNNFGNQMQAANFGMGVYNTLNNQTQSGINAGTNIQNTPLDYQKYFTNSANGVGSGYSTGTTSQTNQGNPLLGALGGAQIGNAWQYPNGRNDIGIYGPGRVSGVNYG